MLAACPPICFTLGQEVFFSTRRDGKTCIIQTKVDQIETYEHGPGDWRVRYHLHGWCGTWHHDHLFRTWDDCFKSL